MERTKKRCISEDWPLSYSAQCRPHFSAPTLSIWTALQCATTMGSTKPYLCPTKPVRPLDDHINNYHSQDHIDSLRTTRPASLTSRLDPVAHTSASCVLPVPTASTGAHHNHRLHHPLAQVLSQPTHARIPHHGHCALVTHIGFTHNPPTDATRQPSHPTHSRIRYHGYCARMMHAQPCSN